jgi:hypothetical protein
MNNDMRFLLVSVLLLMGSVGAAQKKKLQNHHVEQALVVAFSSEVSSLERMSAGTNVYMMQNLCDPVTGKISDLWLRTFAVPIVSAKASGKQFGKSLCFDLRLKDIFMGAAYHMFAHKVPHTIKKGLVTWDNVSQQVSDYFDNEIIKA